MGCPDAELQTQSCPGKIEVVEFDYKGKNHVIYQENGATIRSWPAIHAGDGPVSFSLEWNGLKIVIGGDTFPNKWYIKYEQNADIAIHDVFLTPDELVKWYRQSPGQALGVGTQIHTSPPAFGKVMSTIKPRQAIGYHFFNEESTRYGIYDGVRETYSGLLSLATDNMVWNVTKEGVRTLMAVVNPEGFPTPPLKEKKVEAGGDRYQTPDSVLAGWPEEFNAVADKIYSDFNKEHETEFKFQLKK